MKTQLEQQLQEFIAENNPDLLLRLQEKFSIRSWLDEKIATVMPLMQQLLQEGTPAYIVSEECMQVMTADLLPSKASYLKNILEEEFPGDYLHFLGMGVLGFETVNLIETCMPVFEEYGFDEENKDNRFLRYAVIAEVHNYLLPGQ